MKEVQKKEKENNLWETNAKYLKKNKKENKKKEKIENRLFPEILDKKIEIDLAEELKIFNQGDAPHNDVMSRG